jgi:hypothetical protein
MSKSFVLIAVVLTSTIFTLGEASALKGSLGDGNFFCDLFGGTWKPLRNPNCSPWFCRVCVGCLTPRDCVVIPCDYKQCDVEFYRTRPR